MTDDAAGTQAKKNVQGPKLARRQGAGSRGLKVREPHALYRLLHRTAFAPPNVPCTFLGLTVLCHFEPQLVWRVIVCTLVLIIGITTSIGLCAALYDLAKSLSDRDSILPDERGDDLFVPTILCKIMTTVSFIVVLLACATSARVLLAAEAERVLLQKLLETKSTRAWPSQWHQEMDASLAIPVAPTTVCPFGQGCSIEIDWARPVVASTTVYHLQWREQQEQEWSSWGEVSENIGRPLFGQGPCCTMVGLRTHMAYQFRVRAFNVSERWGPWSPPSEPTTVIEAGRSPFSVYVKKPKVPFSLCRFVCVSVFFFLLLGVAGAITILFTNLHPTPSGWVSDERVRMPMDGVDDFGSGGQINTWRLDDVWTPPLPLLTLPTPTPTLPSQPPSLPSPEFSQPGSNTSLHPVYLLQPPLVLAHPPPSPPPPLPTRLTATVAIWGGVGLTASVVVLTLTASGSGSNYYYSDNVTSSLQQKVATTAGINKSLVTIDVADCAFQACDYPFSVRVTATITVPASASAAELSSLLSSAFRSADDASTALGGTVEEVPIITVKSSIAHDSLSHRTDGVRDGFAFITFICTFSGLLYVFAVPGLLGFPDWVYAPIVLCVAAVGCGILVFFIAWLMVLPWLNWLGFNATVIVGIIAFSVSIPVTCACLLWPKRHVRAMDTTKTMAGANATSGRSRLALWARTTT